LYIASSASFAFALLTVAHSFASTVALTTCAERPDVEADGVGAAASCAGFDAHALGKTTETTRAKPKSLREITR
jgi:N-formylglutamate amidohydrolase